MASNTTTSMDEESTLVETTKCAGYCEQQVPVAQTVDVVVGEKIGEWMTPKVHVGVAGVDVAHPETEKWCVDCANNEFDIEKPAGERSVRRTNRIITPSNIASFVAGLAVMLIVASIFIV